MLNPSKHRVLLNTPKDLVGFLSRPADAHAATLAKLGEKSDQMEDRALVGAERTPLRRRVLKRQHSTGQQPVSGAPGLLFHSISVECPELTSHWPLNCPK